MSENYYKELAKFQKDNGVKTDENLLERKLYETEILTRWQDPTIEDLKKLCKEEFLKNIKENIKSGTIFTYVDGLEKENNKQKEVIDKIKEYLEEDDWTSVNGVIAVKLIKEKLNELLEEIE